MTTRLFASLLPALALAVSAFAADPAPAAAASLVAPVSALEKVADGFCFTEGPTADARGNVCFFDQPWNRIQRCDAATGKVSIFLNPPATPTALASPRMAGSGPAPTPKASSGASTPPPENTRSSSPATKANSSTAPTTSASIRAAACISPSLLQAPVMATPRR